MVLPAGDFSSWLATMLDALAGDGATDVPCGECTACCRSSQFVHVGPDETAALARIPAELLFPAPGLPPGHVLLGYDESGRCPMLGEHGCTIYDDRPRTCRTYDCRVFPAAGIEPDEPTKAAIAERVREWRFEHPGPDDAARHAAVTAAARFLRDHPDALPPEHAPTTATQLAVAGVEAHAAFLGGDPDAGAVRVEVLRRRGLPPGSGRS